MSRYAKLFAALVIGGSSIAMIAAAPPLDGDGGGVDTRAESDTSALTQFDIVDSHADGFCMIGDMRNAPQTGRVKHDARKTSRRRLRDRTNLSNLSAERWARVDAQLDRVDADWDTQPADGPSLNNRRAPNPRALTQNLDFTKNVESVSTREQLEDRIREQLQKGLPKRP